VVVTDSNFCSASSDTIRVSNDSLPKPNLGNVAFCLGDSATLNAGPNHAGFVWSNGAVSQTITVNAAGNYSVTVLDFNGCLGADTATVTVNPLPNVNL